MTDLLTPNVVELVAERVSDLEMGLRDVYDELPHEFKAEIVDGGIQLMSPGGERHGTAAPVRWWSLRLK